jgi:ribosome biogenesis protein NSA2
VQLPILSVKKNPNSPLYTQLGVLTRGTVIEVNVSELGIVTTAGKVVWGKWAQVTNVSRVRDRLLVLKLTLYSEP